MHMKKYSLEIDVKFNQHTSKGTKYNLYSNYELWRTKRGWKRDLQKNIFIKFY